MLCVKLWWIYLYIFSDIKDDPPVVYHNKKEAMEGFKALLKDKKISSTCSWEAAMKTIITDHRYGALKHLAEKKQAFNQYKIQKGKEEKVGFLLMPSNRSI